MSSSAIAGKFTDFILFYHSFNVKPPWNCFMYKKYVQETALMRGKAESYPTCHTKEEEIQKWEEMHFTQLQLFSGKTKAHTKKRQDNL